MTRRRPTAGASLWTPRRRRRSPPCCAPWPTTSSPDGPAAPPFAVRRRALGTGGTREDDAPQILGSADPAGRAGSARRGRRRVFLRPLREHPPPAPADERD